MTIAATRECRCGHPYRHHRATEPRPCESCECDKFDDIQSEMVLAMINSGEQFYGFTFGMAYDLRGCYAIVKGAHDEARLEFVEARRQSEANGGLPDSERRWAFQYPVNAEFLGMIRRHDLRHVSAFTPIGWADKANPQE